MHLLRKFLTLIFMFPGYEKDKHYINVTKSFPLKTIFNHFEENNQTTKTMIVQHMKLWKI